MPEVRATTATVAKPASRRRVERKSEAGTQRQQRLERKRQQIFSAALACFERKGYYETTMIDIANMAGVSSGLIYNYFSDKRDLLFQVILEILEAYNRWIPKALVGKVDPFERLHAACHAYFNVIDDRISATLFSYRESASLEHAQIDALKQKELQTNALISQCVQACVDHDLLAPDDVDLVTYHIISAAHTWGLKNWRLKKITTLEKYFTHHFNMMIRSMITPTGRRQLETGKYMWSESILAKIPGS